VVPSPGSAFPIAELIRRVAAVPVRTWRELVVGLAVQDAVLAAVAAVGVLAPAGPQLVHLVEVGRVDDRNVAQVGEVLHQLH